MLINHNFDIVNATFEISNLCPWLASTELYSYLLFERFSLHSILSF